jgi:hypothetical protein
MTIAERTKVLRFFAVDLSRYSSYEEVRLVVERSDPVPLLVPSFPYSPPALSVFVTLLLDPAELGGEHRLLLEVVGSDGKVVACRDEVFDLPADAVVSGAFPISLVVNFEGLRFTGPGTCEVQLGLDGEGLETLPVEIGAQTSLP